MGKIVIKDGVKWDYDPIWRRYTYIEKVLTGKPIEKVVEKPVEKVVEEKPKFKPIKNEKK